MWEINETTTTIGIVRHSIKSLLSDSSFDVFLLLFRRLGQPAPIFSISDNISLARPRGARPRGVAPPISVVISWPHDDLTVTIPSCARQRP
jgi:hypothetical protein